MKQKNKTTTIQTTKAKTHKQKNKQKTNKIQQTKTKTKYQKQNIYETEE